MAAKFPIHPGHPERICWGCEHFCPADEMRCGNGTDRAQHPVELWGEDWMSLGFDETPAQPTDPTQSPSTGPGRAILSGSLCNDLPESALKGQGRRPPG